MALGFADGYHWSHIKEVAIHIRDEMGQWMELSYPKDRKIVRKIVKRFLIVVPSELDWHKEDPIADFRSKRENGGDFKDCQIQKSARPVEHKRQESS